MPTTITGAAIPSDPGSQPSASCPVDTEAASAASVNTPFQSILNALGWLRQKCALRDMAGSKITNVGNPTAAGDVTTKGYVDGAITTEATARSSAVSSEASARAGAVTAAISTANTNADTKDTALLASIASRLPKAWALIKVNEGGGATVLAGYNIASASWSNNYMIVVFGTPLSDAEYAIECGFSRERHGLSAPAINREAAAFRLIISNFDTGGVFSADDEVSLSVHHA